MSADIFLSFQSRISNVSVAQRVTNETYRWVSDARFHPSGSEIIATKWYTSERSLGAGEGWVYPVPSADGSRKKPIHVGSGKRLISRTLPFGWSAEDYGNQQIGPEQFIWNGNDSVIYSKNVIDAGGAFEYSKGQRYLFLFIVKQIEIKIQTCIAEYMPSFSIT